ncbi:hypothetical protein [Nocardioides sp. GXQ0305]|uniref:hypothetical protein n=1 Tax=Nocardioides sp. GXQ0305 TaxID=3423912 RepID=UPI003D7DE2B4
MGVVVLVAVAGTLVAVPLGGAVGIGLFLGVFGGAMGLAFRSDLPRVRHPVLAGAAVCAAPALYPGLSEAVGHGAALAVVAALVLTCPWLHRRAARGLRRLVPPRSVGSGATAPPDRALRLQWDESTRQLERASTVGERLLLVRVREQILDDLVAASGGVLPGDVWAGAGRHER